MIWAFRVASDPAFGSGHLARCKALADALGSDVDWFLDPFPAPPWASHATQEATTGACDGLYAALTTKRHSVVVVDHYSVSRKDLAAISAQCRCIAIVDSVDELPVHHRLVHGVVGKGRLPQSDRGGPEYALLAPKFAACRELAMRQQTERPLLRLLIAFGSRDSANRTGLALTVLEELERARRLPSLFRSTILLPSHAPHYSAVREAAARIHSVAMAPEDAPVETLCLGHDLALGAPGVSMLERAACGLPSLLLLQDEVQRAAAKGADELGIARLIDGASDAEISERLAEALPALLGDEQALQAMRQFCLTTVDGAGARRAAEWMRQCVTVGKESDAEISVL